MWLELANGFKAIDAGELDVQKNQVERFPRNCFHHFTTGAHRPAILPQRLSHSPHDQAIDSVVIADKNTLRPAWFPRPDPSLFLPLTRRPSRDQV